MIFVIGGAYQGKTDYVREHLKGQDEMINHYHLRIKKQMREGLDPMQEAQTLLREQKDIVIISDEVGSGLVPTDAFERAYREMTGRVHCYLAGEADQVIRVVCGIGSRIK